MSHWRRNPDYISSEDEDEFSDTGGFGDEDGWQTVTGVGEKRKHGDVMVPSEIAPHKVMKLGESSARLFREQVAVHAKQLWARQKELMSAVNRRFGVNLGVQVVQAAFSLGCTLNMRTLAENYRNVRWASDNSVIIRVHRWKPKNYTAHFQVYASGRVTVLGTRSIADMYREVRYLARGIQQLGFPMVMLKNFRIRNLTGSCKLPFFVSLSKLYELPELKDVMSYDPERFPRVVVRLLTPKCTIQVFASGSLVLSGVTTVEELCEAVRAIHPLLDKVRAFGSEGVLPVATNIPSPSTASA